MDKSASIPKEKPKRKRRNAEEVLVEEARANVFGGTDLSQPESEALALVMHAEAITAAVEKQQLLPNHQYTVSASSRSAAQKKEEDTMALTLWKKKWATAPPTANDPARRGGRGQHPPLVRSSAGITNSSSSQSSLALVPLNLKQSRPKASPASTSIAKPAALVKPTPLTNAKKKPNNNNDYEQNNDDNVNNNSSARHHRPSLIPIDSRWKEYPKVCEDVVEEVLTKMNQRTANDVQKKQNMRAGILDVLYTGVTIKKSAEDRLVGRTTMRRYCNKVKQQLVDCLGNEQLLRQLGHQKKKELSLKTLRTEMLKVGGNDKAVALQPEPVDEEEETPEGKTPGNRKRKAPKEEEEKANNLASKQARRTPAATAKSADSSKEKVPVTNNTSRNTQQKKNTAKTDQKTPADSAGQLIVASGGTMMKALISTRTEERQRFRGTKRQLRDIVKELAKSKYQGNPEQFADVITDLIIMDRSVKKAMARHGFPLELVQMGCRLVNRFYDIEEILEE